MTTHSQATPHGAGSDGRFTPETAAEMGARGAAKRESNWQARISATRQELASHADAAVARIAHILEHGRDTEALKAAIALLDRIGVGPHSSQEQSIGVSLMEQWARELEAMEADGGEVDAR